MDKLKPIPFKAHQWYEHLFKKEMYDANMERYLKEAKKLFAINYVFLPRDQILGKLFDFLGIPNVCGKVNKKKLFKVYKSVQNADTIIYYDKKNIFCDDDTVRSSNTEENIFPVLSKPDEFEMFLTRDEETSFTESKFVAVKKEMVEGFSSSDSSDSMNEFLYNLKNLQVKFPNRKRRKRKNYLPPIPEDSIVYYSNKISKVGPSSAEKRRKH